MMRQAFLCGLDTQRGSQGFLRGLQDRTHFRKDAKMLLYPFNSHYFKTVVKLSPSDLKY